MQSERGKQMTCGSVNADKPHCPYLICTEGVSVQRGALPLPPGRVWCLSERKTREICTVSCIGGEGTVATPDFCPYRRDGVSWEADAKACAGGKKG